MTSVLGASDGQFPGAWYGLDDDVRFLYARCKEFGFGAGEERLNYCCR